MARLETIGAFALTEPDHGSDSVALETSARRDGDDYVLDGEKRWIGNASFADVIDRLGARRRTATSALRRGEGRRRAYPTAPTELITGKIGKRAVWQAGRHARRTCASPRRTGSRAPTRSSDANRCSPRPAAARRGSALGHAVAALRGRAWPTPASAQQFGRPIASFQLVQNKLADMLAEITAMQLSASGWRSCRPQGRMTGPMASLAKMHNARKARAGLRRRARHPRRQRPAARLPRRAPP